MNPHAWLGAVELTPEQSRFWGTVPLVVLAALGLLLFAWFLFRDRGQRGHNAPSSGPFHVAVTAVALDSATCAAYGQELALTPVTSDCLEGLQACIEALLQNAPGWTHFGYGDTVTNDLSEAQAQFERTRGEFSQRLETESARIPENSRVHVVAFITLTNGELRGLTRLDDRAQSVQCLQARLALPERALIKFHAFPPASIFTAQQFSSRFPEMERLLP